MPMASLGEMVHLVRRAAVEVEGRKQLERQERYTRNRPKPPTLDELIERDSVKRKAAEQLKAAEEKEKRQKLAEQRKQEAAREEYEMREALPFCIWLDSMWNSDDDEKLIDKSPACRCILRVREVACKKDSSLAFPFFTTLSPIICECTASFS